MDNDVIKRIAARLRNEGFFERLFKQTRDIPAESAESSSPQPFTFSRSHPGTYRHSSSDRSFKLGVEDSAEQWNKMERRRKRRRVEEEKTEVVYEGDEAVHSASSDSE